MDNHSALIASLLADIRLGKEGANQSLMQLVYQELKRLASRRMKGERPNHTLQTTAVVHEAYLRLGGIEGLQNINDRRHLLAVAARQMRYVLVDYARARSAERRDGGIQVELHERDKSERPLQMDVLSVHEALERLEKDHLRPAQVVESKFFGGYTDEETAELLDVSLNTVRRDWDFARAWLIRQLTAAPPPRP